VRQILRPAEEISGLPTPALYDAQRGRLVDSYIDAHKYLFEKRAAIYGDEDLVCALAGFLKEIGVSVALCVTGGRSMRLRKALQQNLGDAARETLVLEDADFSELAEAAKELNLDLMIGNSNGYRLSRELGVPLVRVGLPIHDRIGAARLLHVGYEGTQQLLDRITNALLAAQQDANPVGYTHL
jgi:nitrogenase molybdenum-iron protein NifN